MLSWPWSMCVEEVSLKTEKQSLTAKTATRSDTLTITHGIRPGTLCFPSKRLRYFLSHWHACERACVEVYSRWHLHYSTILGLLDLLINYSREWSYCTAARQHSEQLRTTQVGQKRNIIKCTRWLLHKKGLDGKINKL